MLKLFSGTAHPKLSQEVSRLIKIPLAKSEVVRFGNSEVRVTIQENVRDMTCVLIQSTSNPTDTNLMELIFFCDALRRQEAKHVVAYIPYFGYARQDIQHRSGECVSANVVIRFFESIGFSKIYTVDIHDESTEGIFSIPYRNLTSLPLLADAIKKYLKNSIDFRSIAIVSPDQGGVERSRHFGEHFFGSIDFNLSVIEKKRDLNQIHKSEALNLYGDVKGKIVILVDDIVTSGGTLINATHLCLKQGASRVLAAIVHHDFANDAVKLLQSSKIEKFFTTNTILLRSDQNLPKLVEVSIAPLIAKEIKNFL